MKADWQQKPFESCIEPVEYTRKIQRKDFLTEGQFPIVSQEAEFTNGYWNDEADVFKVEKPLVVFGDHTQVLKYVDFDFVLGADGVKILQPRDFLHPKFFFYQLQVATFTSLGYARHYRLLRERQIGVTAMPEQQRIVAILDEAFDGIAAAKANAEKNLQNARELFGHIVQSSFSADAHAWTRKKLGDVCTFINGRAYRKEEMLSVGKYPLLRVGNFFTNKDWYYSDLELDEDKYCENGDLLYAWSASFGPRIWNGGKVIYHYHIWKVIPRAEIIHQQFLLHLLEWDVEQIKAAHGTGTTMMHVGKGSMESRLVPIPPLNIQEKLSSMFDEALRETQCLESIYQKKLRALDELKKTLLHQAFTGAL